MNNKTCSRCKKTIITESPVFSGYGTDDSGNIFCYACCAERDRETMRNNDRIVLYLTHNNLTDQNELHRPEWEVTNWPGTLRYAATVSTQSKNTRSGVFGMTYGSRTATVFGGMVVTRETIAI